tara:strand:- start:859 stop:1446 length:588 start_codon:yes stop_codon:yes gene_type:complete
MKKQTHIVFLGPDGSGKSSIIEKIKVELDKKKISYKHIHLKPNFFSKKIKKLATDPHNQVLRSNFLSFIKLIQWLIVFKIFFFIEKFSKKKVLLFDRYPHDILIDPLRYRFNLSEKLTCKILDFFPKPNYWVVMTGSPNKIFERKKEVELKTLKNQIFKYEIFAKKKSNSFLISRLDDHNLITKIILKRENFSNT